MSLVTPRCCTASGARGSAAFPVAGPELQYRELLAAINRIKAVDNHCHSLPIPDVAEAALRQSDPLGKSAEFQEARLRVTNPELLDAWRALYGYTHRDTRREHIRELFAAKQRQMRKKGDDYPGWVLDQAGIEVALVNAPQLGTGQTPQRFRLVPFADGFLFPFETKNPYAQRRRKEVGLDTAPASFESYLEKVVKELRRWKGDGAVAIKFQIAYFRPLDFAEVPLEQTKMIYERQLKGTGPAPGDHKALQDFLFRYVVREAGVVGLVVHIHTGEGGGPYFTTTGSNPLLLEPVLNDATLRGTAFVLVHGGFPFDRQITSLIKKPNVYVDFSGQALFRSSGGLSETLGPWLELFPEKVLFGTDAFEFAPLRSWEEMLWLANRTGRRGLALALQKMIAAGDVTRPRAEEIARLVLRENAMKLYGFAGQPYSAPSGDATRQKSLPQP